MAKRGRKLGWRKVWNPREKKFLYQRTEPVEHKEIDPLQEAISSKNFFVTAPIGRTEEEAEFWAKVEITDNHWVYHRPTGDKTRYEKLRRLAWNFSYGKPPTGWYIEKWCDDQKCVRPSHMFLADILEHKHIHSSNPQDLLDSEELSYIMKEEQKRRNRMKRAWRNG